jgi:hypothetical protein
MKSIFAVAYPVSLTSVQEMLNDAELNLKADGTLQRFDEMPLAITKQHLAILISDGIDVDVPELTDRLAPLLTQMQNGQSSRLVSITCKPRSIGQSALKPWINGLRAEMLTNAQRRNDDTDLEHVWNSMYQRSLVALLDTLFNDIENIEYSLAWSRHDHILTVELKIDARSKSPLDQYIARIKETGNRSLSWLHPDHTYFAAMSLPLPELVQETMPQFATVFSAAIKDSFGISQHSSREVDLLLNQFRERGIAQQLVQAIPAADGSTAVIGIIPLEGDIAFSPALLELASAIEDSQLETSITDFNGWPVHRLREPATEFDISGDLYLVATDHSLAWMMGSEQALSVFENVVQRQYSADPTGDRFRRSAFAMQATLASLADTVFAEEIRKYLPQDPEANRESLQDQIEVVIDTEPHSLLITARFQPDVCLPGLHLYEKSFEQIINFFEELD